MVNIGIGGKLSSGKTSYMVATAIGMQKESGKGIIANFHMNIPYLYQSDKECIEFLHANIYNHDALRERYKGKIWMIDEIYNLLDARTPNHPINALVTKFIMMLGKLDCDCLFTYQIKESQADLRLREIMDDDVETMRIYDDFTPVIRGGRKLDRPILVVAQVNTDLGMLGSFPFMDVIDPSDVFPLYDTTELMLLDRSKYDKLGRSSA